MSDDLRIPYPRQASQPQGARMPAQMWAGGHDDGLRAAVSPGSDGYRQRLHGGSRARRDGMGVSGRAMTIGAAALGGVLVLGLGGWAAMHRGPARVPVIEADGRPIRVKPDNPGGMQFAGADELGDGGTGRDKMAPVAETPAPQALRAQMQQGAPAAVPAAAGAPVVTAAVPAPSVGAAVPAGPVAPAAANANPAVDTAPREAKAPVAAPRPAVKPVPVASASEAPAPAPVVVAAPGPVVAAAPGSASPAAPVQKSSGATLVQLGALGSEAAAQAEWQRLAHSQPGLLGSRQPVVQKVERDGRSFWRLRTGGFSDIADATGFCAKVKATGGNCTIASF